MSLPKLVPSEKQVLVQETDFSTDGLGRLVCSTWDEAVNNGGPPFSAVVIGAGAYGAYLAAKIRQEHGGARVLVLDAGSFLVPEHVQNVGRLGLEVPAPLAPADDPGFARALVWGLPWRGNVDFPGLAYCTGGKSLYWGGWCPRLTGQDLAGWPASVAAYLNTHYTDVESETGVVPGTDFIFGELNAALLPMLIQASATTPHVDTGNGSRGVQEAPLAVQGNSPESGLFSFDKYSSLPLLIDAIRRDVRDSQGNDANRRLFLIPRAHVIKLKVSGNAVNSIEINVAGQPRLLTIDSSCKVILSASAIESTRLAMLSFPTNLMGRNLMAHTRSDFTFRVHRSIFPPLPARVQTAAFLIRGKAPSGLFHLQVTASTSRDGSDDLLFKLLPDIDQLNEHLSNSDPDWVTLTLRGIAEMHGDRLRQVPNATGSWIDLSPWELDENAVQRAYVHMQLSAQDEQTWSAMDSAAVTLAKQLVGAATKQIQYLYDGGWQTAPFPLARAFPEWHRGLGTTFHESGTLWMGDDPATSVTDTVGRFHHVTNAYACDQSIFPAVGSVNPVLTGLTLASKIAHEVPF